MILLNLVLCGNHGKLRGGGELRKVSFIIPVYNCKNFICECVKSIQKINLENYEIILIDDGSTDGSSRVCDVLVSNNEHIQCVHQKNTGVSAARNKGIEMADGDYIIFVDGDDTVDSELFNRLFNRINRGMAVDLIIYGMSFDYYRNQNNYRSDLKRFPIEGEFEIKQWIHFFEELYENNCISSSCNKIFKKEIIQRFNIKFRQDMFLYEDMEFSLRYIVNCEKIYCSILPIYHYRQTEDEGNSGRRLKRINHIPEVIAFIEKALVEFGEIYKDEFDINQINSILLSLYLVLAREKIAVSNISEIKIVCEDFILWSKSRNLLLANQRLGYINLLLKRKVYRLMLNRNYTIIRHKIAIIVKNSILYKRIFTDG